MGGNRLGRLVGQLVGDARKVLRAAYSKTVRELTLSEDFKRLVTHPFSDKVGLVNVPFEPCLKVIRVT